jgi:signal transduction histidine kinase
LKPRRRWNERTRLLLTLELAVVLPAAALIILSVMHLRTIQRDRQMEAAIRRDFSEVLAISEKQVNHKVYGLADDIRGQMPPLWKACTGTMGKILGSHPYAAHLWIYTADNGMTFASQPEKLDNDPAFQKEADYLSKMFEGWMKVEFAEFSKEMERKAEKGNPYFFESTWVPRGEKHAYTTTAMFVGHDEDSGQKYMAGIVFDADYLKSELFPAMLDSIPGTNLAENQGGEKSRVATMIRAKSDSTPMLACTGWDGGTPEVERYMEGAFPGLVLGMKMRGTTIEAMGQHFINTNFLILGALSLVLAFGIFLTYWNVSKEMALARLKSDFVSNVSHELRTPLSLIRLYAETLELGRVKTADKYHEYYQIIRKESERLTSLINNILDFSRIEAGRKEYEFRETDLRELVSNTMESYRYQIEQQGFTFEEKIDSVPPLRVDREAMARSLVNLVNNALKYSQDRKFVGVNLYRDNGRVKLEVIDHGIGIPVTEQGKIFEKFYRVGDPLVHNTKGSGLGLSLVKHIVQAHGGDVSVDSTPGQGSKFTISLPVETTGTNTQAASA